MISCHTKHEAEYADNFFVQLQKAFFGKKNFELNSTTVRWQGKRIRILFTEFFEDDDCNSVLEESRFSEMVNVLLDKGFSKADETDLKSYDESQIMRKKQAIRERKRFGQAGSISEWEESEFNKMIDGLKSLQSKADFMKQTKTHYAK